MFIARLRVARFALAVGLTLALLAAGVAILSVQPVEAGRPVDESAIYDNAVFLPVMARPLPDVTGVYSTVSTNSSTTCGVTLTLPAPMWVTVTQTSGGLKMVFPSGELAGTLNTNTGAFSVSQHIAPLPPECPGGCERITTGTFHRETAPITFDSSTSFYLYSIEHELLCVFSFNQSGTRR